jgi:hypothetical protein
MRVLPRFGLDCAGRRTPADPWCCLGNRHLRDLGRLLVAIRIIAKLAAQRSDWTRCRPSATETDKWRSSPGCHQGHGAAPSRRTTRPHRPPPTEASKRRRIVVVRQAVPAGDGHDRLLASHGPSSSSTHLTRRGWGQLGKESSCSLRAAGSARVRTSGVTTPMISPAASRQRAGGSGPGRGGRESRSCAC